MDRLVETGVHYLVHQGVHKLQHYLAEREARIAERDAREAQARTLEEMKRRNARQAELDLAWLVEFLKKWAYGKFIPSYLFTNNVTPAEGCFLLVQFTSI